MTEYNCYSVISSFFFFSISQSFILDIARFNAIGVRRQRDRLSLLYFIFLGFYYRRDDRKEEQRKSVTGGTQRSAFFYITRAVVHAYTGFMFNGSFATGEPPGGR